MKFYNQVTLNGKPCFDVVWGNVMEEDYSLAIVQSSKLWLILDIASGVSCKAFKTKKAALEWYHEQVNTGAFYAMLMHARETKKYNERVSRLAKHKILHKGDRVTFIDVKDSVILDLQQFSPREGLWIVKDEWHSFTTTADRVIKLSEVN